MCVIWVHNDMLVLLVKMIFICDISYMRRQISYMIYIMRVRWVHNVGYDGALSPISHVDSGT